jgi:hypothetical protein
MTEEEKKKQEQEKFIQLVMDYKNTFESEAGKRVLADLINRTTMYNVRLQSPIDSYQVVLEEGRRSVIVYILKKLSANLDQRPVEAISESKEG